MISKILSWPTGSGCTYFCFLAAIAAFFAGWWVSSTMHQRDFEAAKADYYASLQAQEKTFRKKENDLNSQVAEALAARDDALFDAANARADTDRLRDEADALAKRLSSASGFACDGYRQSLSQCVRLLGEGVALAGEGAGVAQRNAADIEVMRKALGVN